MIQTSFSVVLFLFNAALLSAASLAPASWDLEEVYTASSYVFSGVVQSIELVPELQTGVMGVELSQLSNEDPQFKEIVWQDVRRYTFELRESFKGGLPDAVEVYAPKALTLWSYFETELAIAC